MAVESEIEGLAARCYALVLVTDWDEYLSLDFSKLRNLMNKSLILGARNVLDRDKLMKFGFTYIGFGH